MMLIGIVSSKDGHDESHIDDTKLETKFWNFEYHVIVVPTQKQLTQKVILIAGVNSQNNFPFEHRAT